MYSTRNSCQILMKLEFSRQIFDKYSIIEFHEISPCGGRVVPYGQTDGKREVTNLMVAFHNFLERA